MASSRSSEPSSAWKTHRQPPRHADRPHAVSTRCRRGSTGASGRMPASDLTQHRGRLVRGALPMPGCPASTQPAYFAATSATVVSSIRLEKPHSLSYQLETFTSRPLTLVRVES